MNFKDGFEGFLNKVIEAGEQLKFPAIAKVLYVLLVLYLAWSLRESHLFLVYLAVIGVSWYWLMLLYVKTLKTIVPPTKREIWRKTYSIIKPMRDQKQPWKTIIAFLQTNQPDLPSDETTLRNILAAGDKKLL